MNTRNFAFDRKNYILLAISMVIIIVGLILMSGSGSTETTYNPDIFSTRRVKVAPVVCLIGFCLMIYGVMRKPKNAKDQDNDAPAKGDTTMVE